MEALQAQPVFDFHEAHDVRVQRGDHTRGVLDGFRADLVAGQFHPSDPARRTRGARVLAADVIDRGKTGELFLERGDARLIEERLAQLTLQLRDEAQEFPRASIALEENARAALTLFFDPL